ANIDSVVGFHHEDEWPALADLDRLRWHKRRILEHVENETHLHKLRRPQCPVGIGRDGASFYGSGARLHCVVDEVKIARARFDRTIRQIGLHLHVGPADISSYKRKIVLSYSEVVVYLVE